MNSSLNRSASFDRQLSLEIVYKRNSMKINKSFLRIAIAAGLIGLAACGGSDSSSRNRNSEIATNVKRYQGTIQVSGGEFGSRTNPDKYSVSFDMNLDAVSTQEFVTGTNNRGDFRNAFSKFSIEKDPSNQGSQDLSTVKWAQCPYDSYFYKDNDTTMSEFQIVFAEATNSDIASAPCGRPTLREDKRHQAGWWTSNGEYVAPNSGARYLTFYFRQPLEIGAEDFPSLVSLLPKGLDPYFTETTNLFAGVAFSPYTLPYDLDFALNLSSTKLKDYQPYDLTATQQTATIDLNWKRSADLVETDVVSYNLLWSTDGSETFVSIPLDDDTEYQIPACLINPENNLTEESKVVLQLIAIDSAGITSPAIEKSVSLTADTVQCPTTDPIAAPTGFTVVASKKTITASWDAIEALDPNGTTYYCVSEVNPNLTDSTNKETIYRQDSVLIDCTTETKMIIKSIRYKNKTEVKYFVQAQSTSGVLSARSEVQTIAVQKEENVSGLTVKSEEGGLTVKWNPNNSKSFDQVILIFSVNIDNNCDKFYEDLLQASLNEDGLDDILNRVGAVMNAETFFLSNDRLGDEYVPGSVVTVCAKRTGLTMWGESPDWGLATYSYPVTALAPVVEETAKTAIVTATATEVQLPAADINLEINLADVYSGFGVSAADVKFVEYQVADGSWIGVANGSSVKIPKAASKMAIRVTKTSGETVVSEKAIERTAATTDTTVATSDTTMAPADTTAPETNETPASSESSSSNNTLLYILGFIIVAGVAGFLIKKKSASTK